MAKQPAHEIRFGLIKALVWQNQAKMGKRSTVTIIRLYKNGNRWVESSRFGHDDLPLVAKAADLAYSWIFARHRDSVQQSCA